MSLFTSQASRRLQKRLLGMGAHLGLCLMAACTSMSKSQRQSSDTKNAALDEAAAASSSNVLALSAAGRLKDHSIVLDIAVTPAFQKRYEEVARRLEQEGTSSANWRLEVFDVPFPPSRDFDLDFFVNPTPNTPSLQPERLGTLSFFCTDPCTLKSTEMLLDMTPALHQVMRSGGKLGASIEVTAIVVATDPKQAGNLKDVAALVANDMKARVVFVP